jgi:hypothetical protein
VIGEIGKFLAISLPTAFVALLFVSVARKTRSRLKIGIQFVVYTCLFWVWKNHFLSAFDTPFGSIAVRYGKHVLLMLSMYCWYIQIRCFVRLGQAQGGRGQQ